MLKSRTGRRRGKTSTRTAILKAARALFARKGYGGATFRAVAAQARVDPGLVVHFFGSKAELFEASLELPFHPAELQAVLAGDRKTLGRRFAAFYLGSVFHHRAQTVQSLLRSCVSHPEAAAILRRAIESTAVGLLEAALPGPEAALRGELVASQMMGLFFARHLLRVEPLAAASEERLIDLLGPALQLTLTSGRRE